VALAATARGVYVLTQRPLDFTDLPSELTNTETLLLTVAERRGPEGAQR